MEDAQGAKRGLDLVIAGPVTATRGFKSLRSVRESQIFSRLVVPPTRVGLAIDLEATSLAIIVVFFCFFPSILLTHSLAYDEWVPHNQPSRQTKLFFSFRAIFRSVTVVVSSLDSACKSCPLPFLLLTPGYFCPRGKLGERQG